MNEENRSEDWRRRDRAALWHPFTQHNLWESEEFPVIVSGEGVYLSDADGNCYLDGVSSLWLNVHGHSRPEINRAIKDQLDSIAHSTFLGQSHPPGIMLAERLIKLAPAGLSRVFFSDDGSTAMEIALKMAYQYWRQKQPDRPERKIFITFSSAYHGDTIGSVSLGSIELFHHTYRPLLFPTAVVPAPHCRRCPHPDEKDGCRDGSVCAAALDRALSERAGQVAGVVMEPLVQGAAGMIVHPPGLLSRVRELCHKHGVLLLADEVATGFGRTGEVFACLHENVAPDVMSIGKGISGGYLPIAATLTTEEVFDAFRGEHHSENTFFHGHSYTANQLGCAAALASLDIFEKDKTLENVRSRAAEARAWLEETAKLDHVGEARQRGLMMGIELEQDPETKTPYSPELMMGRKAVLEARKKGLIIRPLGDTVIIMPALCISADELGRVMGITYESIKQATG